MEESDDKNTKDQSVEPSQNLRTAEEVQVFLDECKVPVSRKRMRSLMALSYEAFEAYKLNIICGLCCKNMDIPSAMTAYSAARMNHVIPNQETFFMLLSLVAGLGEQGSGSGPIRQSEPPSDLKAALTVFEDMRRHHISLTESSYTALIRCYAIHDDVRGALEVYDDMKRNAVAPKLRTYLQVLSSLADVGDIANAFILYEDMINIYHLTPTERDYCSMLRVTSRHHDRRFYDILGQMMEDILVPLTQSWKIFDSWFTTIGYNVFESPVNELGVIQSNNRQLLSIELDSDTNKRLSDQIESFALLRAYSKPKNHPVVSDNTVEDSNNGKDKDPREKESEKSTDKDGVADKSLWAMGSDDQEKKDHKKKELKWLNYVKWLDDHQHHDVVVDGANVGYYKQNYLGAPKHVDYKQIDWVIEQLKRDGMKPLLILHQRHTSPQTLPDEFRPIVMNWRAQGIMYETPSGWNDDWFWMYACVKLGCHIVTNDEMRDHHFQMLSPRWFSRWKERHVIHFSFGKWVRDSFEENDADLEQMSSSDGDGHVTKKARHATEKESYRQAVFDKPRPFSLRMQAMERSREDPSRFQEYYFPAADRDTWLCCVLPS